MNIAELIEKCKSKEAYTAALIILVAFASFGLGRLSKLQEGKAPIRIEQASAAVLSSPPFQGGDKGVVKGEEVKIVSGGRVVASKSGTKYHFPWCSGAARISDANKVWFNSVEEARKAGYTPASNCKGLK